MTFLFATAQAIAVLFTVGGIVHVVAEDSPPPHQFSLENSAEGAAAMTEKLVPLRDLNREPFLCVGVAPGVKLEGVVAEEVMAAPIRRFLLAQPMYQKFAEAEGLDPNHAQTLLRACRKQFPKA